ncbi:peptidoglycan recognition family protein [Oceanobacillus sp. FSL W7-1293]|uniref:peptidoglycan recognition protein family protein n=1 Tax=Oceanobacillus sp. FSL W7-1293 TaxID=2921699 RepID=UPI0030CBBEBB
MRGKVMGGGDKRSRITKIARHHSATTSGNVNSFQNHWRSLGWKTGGYHEIILRDGTVQLCYDSNVVTNGVYGHNQNTYHICVVGNGSFTAAQEKAFEERAKYNLNRFGLKASDVLGHREFSGASTSCPGINMNTVRSRLSGSTSNSTSSKPSKPSSGLAVDGKWGNSTTLALQKALGTPRDGIISKQPRNSVTQSLYGNTVQFGNGGSNVIVALQKKVGATADGKLGPATIRALQKHLGTPVDGALSRPSMVVEEMQRRLNAGTF